MGLDLRAPDHTTLSRRGRYLDLSRRRGPKRAGLHLIIDSSGLSIVGEGEWATAKHGRRGRRGWKKLHLGVDPTGVIVAHALTEATLDDATTGVELIAAVNDDITRVAGDAAYDTVAFYETASARGATVVVPPAKTARVSPRGPRSRVRDRTINTVKKIGRCRWKKTSRYQQQARVENAFFRYTSIIGDGLRAKTPGGRTAETLLACNILNTMTDMGRPNSCAMGRCGTIAGILPVSFDCRVAPGDCSSEALTRTGLGGFHHPALPLMWLMAMRPRFARESEARAEDIVPTTQRTSARGPLPFECLVT